MNKNDVKNLIALPYYLKRQNIDINEIKRGAINYTEKNKRGSNTFCFSKSASNTNLFSAVYAALIYGLTEEKVIMSGNWKEYFDSFQCEDGIWRDRKNPFRNWEASDEWNDIHIIPHIIYGYETINAVPEKEFRFLDKFHDSNYVSDFCNSIDFENFWGDSNGVMNYLVSMIYARDIMGDNIIGKSIEYIMTFLKKRMDETGGLWTLKRDKASLYEAIRGGYHVWMLMIQEGVKFNEGQIKNIIDCILSLQNKYGGFNDKIIADTCQNIDCIDPLVRFSFMLPEYRKDDIEKALSKARNYLLNNRNTDGGFCFNRMSKFQYGNDVLVSERNESNMFATWFSLLALLLIEEYFSGTEMLHSALPGMEYKVDKKKYNYNSNCEKAVE